MIRQGTRAGKYPSAVDFCRELEVCRDTVMRDLDFLRDEERAPIEYDRSAHGYRLSDETWQLPAVELSRREVFSLCIARKLLGAFRGTPLAADMAAAMGKIARSLEGKLTIASTELADRFAVVSDDYVVVDPEVWSATAAAVDAGEAIRMRYEKFHRVANRDRRLETGCALGIVVAAGLPGVEPETVAPEGRGEDAAGAARVVCG
jgi:predicted DNA-binding transcriptional regulator YafY